MNAPWAGKTGLAKAIAIAAVTLGISTGLCGLNFVAVLASSAHADNWFQRFLFGAAYLELLVMIVSLVAVVVLAIISIVRDIVRKNRD